MGRQARYEYVIYKGDEVVCGGTRKECAEKLDVTVEAVTKISSDSYKKIIGCMAKKY